MKKTSGSLNYGESLELVFLSADPDELVDRINLLYQQ